MEESEELTINQKGIKLLSELYNNEDLGFDETSELLSKFRVLTREKSLNSQVLDSRCIDLLVTHSTRCQTEAQMCISNLILNYEHLREQFIEPYFKCAETRFSTILSDNLEIDSPLKSTKRKYDVLYYDFRIIFLLSALCPTNREQIRLKLLEPILNLTEKESSNYSQDNHLLVVESLKTLFNLTVGWTIDSPLAGKVIKSLIEIAGTGKDITDAEDGTKLGLTEQLLVNLIHLLTNMPEEVYLKLSDEDVDKILDHLDNQLKSIPVQRLRESVLPVLNVCTNICKYHEEIRERWFDSIVASEKNFDKRPEECDTLRGRLVKLMTSVDVHIKDIAAEFMYALCGKDTEKFITYTGFGNSAAFLSSRGLLGLPRTSVDNRPGESEYKELSEKIDPITGKLQTPRKDPMEGLSEEEKEYHAHELADAITKLTNLGVVKPLSINQDGKIADFHPNSVEGEDS